MFLNSHTKFQTGLLKVIDFCKKVYFSFIFKYDCKLPLSILILEILRVKFMRFMRFLSMLEKEETLASELDPLYVSLSS